MPSYLYNGVELPALPEWDKEQYPYSLIFVSDSLLGHYAYFCAFSTPQHRNYEYNNEPHFTLEAGETCLRATIYNRSSNDFSGYVFTPQVMTASELSSYGTNPIWANYDVLDENGELLLAASAPVPVLNPSVLMQGFMMGDAVKRMRK